MKTILTLGLILAAASLKADVSMTFSPDLVIPEGNPAGVVDSESFTVGPADGIVTSITVGLTTSGGYNGDLYAYLVAPNGTRVTLMDQPGTAVDGFGAESSGMNIELADGPYASIQDVTGGAGTTLNGTYLAAYELSAFDGSLIDGTWNIFFADLGSDAGSPVLESWTLDMNVVPEPVNVALGIFLGSLLVAKAGRLLLFRKSS